MLEPQDSWKVTAFPKDRPGWHEYFMEITMVVSRRATCLRRQVGALLVKDRRILTTGYNGPPAGLPHCDELGGCLRDRLGVPSGERMEISRALHAEQNALVQAARHGINVRGAVLYCTNAPCFTCAKMLVNAGIVEIIYLEEYPDQLARELLAAAGVPCTRFADLHGAGPAARPEEDTP